MSRGVAVMRGGELVISSPAHLDAISRALRGLATIHWRRDGIGPSPVLRELIDASDLALHLAAGTPVLRESASQTDFQRMDDFIGTAQAAELLGVSDRDVRSLCQRGTLAGATRAKGAWRIPREVVLARSESKEN